VTGVMFVMDGIAVAHTVPYGKKMLDNFVDSASLMLLLCQISVLSPGQECLISYIWSIPSPPVDII